MTLEKTSNGIEFTEQIESNRGASFILFPQKHHSKQDVENAKDEIRDNRDVVHIRTAKEKDRDDLYKSEYFRHPKVRPLKWYQIMQDSKIIRRERRKGTSIDDFVEKFVVHRTKLTEEKFRKKFGSKMYNF